MKMLLLLTFATTSLWGKSLVVVGHFDPFGKAPFNNSTTVAKEIAARLAGDQEVEVSLCPLSTSFDKAFLEMESCVRSAPTPPSLILGLGEAFCEMKIETMGRNLDNTFGPDNDGVERKNKKIIEDASDVLGIKAPVAQMYCSLTPMEQKNFSVSSNPGSFVCNNLIFQYLHQYPEERLSFIHVPSHNCKNLEFKNQQNIPKIITMIKSGIRVQSTEAIPTTKKGLRSKSQEMTDSCLKRFYRSIKGSDERGYWK